MKKRAYSLTNVNQVDLDPMLKDRVGQSAVLGLDVGKERIVGVVRWQDGVIEKPWKIANPQDISALVERAGKLSVGRSFQIGMEPTGTYGDPLRQAFADAGLVVRRVSTKAAHDYAEVYDNVPSQHDGKDAAVVAELVALGKSREWPLEAGDAWLSELDYWVRRLESTLKARQRVSSELEGLLARHWPELNAELKVSSATLLKIVNRYGGPKEFGEDPHAAEKVRRWSFGRLSEERIAQLVLSAQTSHGVRLDAWSRRLLIEQSEEGLRLRGQMKQVVSELARLSQQEESLRCQSSMVGSATACVLRVYLGSASSYDHAGAYRKAMGLNLAERSSGKYQGQLRISKRGHPSVRRWLYFAALRSALKEPTKSWFASKRGQDPKLRKGTPAAVSVMRKLALALYWVGVKCEKFDASQLFSVKPALARKKRRRRKRRGSQASKK